jgi:phospholipase C
MWRGRFVGDSRKQIVAVRVDGPRSRRVARLAMFALTAAMTLLWAHGSIAIPVGATSAVTSPSVVQSFGSALATARTQLSVSPNVATSAGNLLVLVVEVRRSNPLATVSRVSDTGGNSWAKAAAVHRGSTDEEMWYAPSASTISPSGSVSVTATSSAAIAATVIELSGMRSSAPLDATATKFGASATPSTGTTVATDEATEVAVAGIGWNRSTTPSHQTAGYSLLAVQQSRISSEATGEQAGVRVLSATGTQGYAARLSASVPWTGIIATFDAAGAPGSPIKHVVVIYQENHTFDNLLGFWCAQTGHCIGMPPTVTLKPLTAGDQPWVVTPSVTPDIVPGLGHDVAAQTAAMDGGLMDGWEYVGGCASQTAPACVSGYTPTQVPNATALASSFAISDMTFSEADSPSWGGHLYAVAATTDGFTGDIPHCPGTGGWTCGPGWGCDSTKVSPWMDPSTSTLVNEPSCVPDPALSNPNGGAFAPTPVSYVPTIMDRLDAAALPWKIYATVAPPNTPNGFKGSYTWSTCPSFAECLDGPQRANLVPTAQVISDASGGTLPSFSLVLPGSGIAEGTSQHNGTSMTVGDNWIGTLISALENGPDWSSTAVFITYDDCGCFYDQVAPGVNPDGSQQGVRVPLLIVSPYAIHGYVDSTPTTFAGILAFVEHTFELAPLNVNDAGAYAFGNAFNFAQTPLAPVPMVQRPVSAAARAATQNAENTDDPT